MVYISYNPLCSAICKTTCPACKIETKAYTTGRDWRNEKTGEKLIEVMYNDGIKMVYDVIPSKYIKNV